MKKIICLAIAVAAVLSLASCSLKSLNLGKTDSTTLGDVTTAVEDDTAEAYPNEPTNITVKVNGEVYFESDFVDYIAYSNYLQLQYYYGQYLEMLGIDTTKSLKEQNPSESAQSFLGFDSTKSWYQNLIDIALPTATDLAMLSARAKAEGLTLTDTEKKSADEYVQSFTDDAVENGMTLEDSLKDLFTDKVTEQTLRNYVESYYLANKVVDKALESFNPTTEEMNLYVENHKTDFYKVSFRYWAIEFTDETVGKADTIKMLQEIQILSERTEENTKAICEKYSATYAEITDGTTNDDDYSLIEVAIRCSVEGNDMFSYTDTENGIGYVGFVTEKAVPNDDGSVVCDIRHILVEDEATANKVVEEYNAGEKTAEAFGELAAKYSTDSGSSSNGGLYEDVSEGEMVTNFNDWMFDKSRQLGDIGIVTSDYGYHVMLCVDLPRSAFLSTVKTAMESDEYDAFMADTEAKYVVTTE